MNSISSVVLTPYKKFTSICLVSMDKLDNYVTDEFVCITILLFQYKRKVLKTGQKQKFSHDMKHVAFS